MCFLVNFVKERIQSELVEKLYKVNQLAVEKKSVHLPLLQIANCKCFKGTSKNIPIHTPLPPLEGCEEGRPICRLLTSAKVRPREDLGTESKAPGKEY